MPSREAWKSGSRAPKGLNSLNGIPHVTGGAGDFPVQNIETAQIPGLIGGSVTVAT